MREFSLRPPGDGKFEFNDWLTVPPRTNVTGEFFVFISVADSAVGDSLAIQTDNGAWVNGHGMKKRMDGGFEPLTAARGRKPNPLIYAIVLY
jgi:hypothetical protein